jgi:ABC-type transport system involved in cytochrome bd biosynthesis fused ATPase/permease subunit
MYAANDNERLKHALLLLLLPPIAALRYAAPVTWALLSLYHILALPWYGAIFAVVLLDPILAGIWPLTWAWFFLH